MKRLLTTLCMGVIALPTMHAADTIRGWSGDGTGAFPGATPPTSFTEKGRSVDKKPVVTEAKGIAWKLEGLYFGKSQPVVFGDLVLTQVDPNILVAVHSADGSEAWRAANSQEDYLSPEQLAHFQALRAEKAASEQALKGFVAEFKKFKKDLLASSDKGLVDSKSWKAAFSAKPSQKEGALPSDSALAETWKKLAAQVSQYGFTPGRRDDWSINEETASSSVALGNEFSDWPRPGSWRTEVGASFATPVVEGGHAYVAYGNNVVACYDQSGKKVWGQFDHKSREGIKRATVRGELEFCASPLIAGDLLIVAQGCERMRAYDKKTGDKKWEVNYPKGERWMAGTPAIAQVGTLTVIIAVNGKIYNAVDGSILNESILMPHGTSSPVVVNGIAYIRGQSVPGNKGKAAMAAYQLADEGGSLSVTQLWLTNSDLGDQNRSLVVDGGYVYSFRGADKKAKRSAELLVFSASDGSLKTTVACESKDNTHQSLAITDSHLVMYEVGGNFVFFTKGDKPEIVARCETYGGSSYAKPTFHENKIFMRSIDALYCITGE